MNTHFWPFWGLEPLFRAPSGWGGSNFFGLNEIFSPWAFEQYMTRPYLMNTHFWSFLGLGPVLGEADFIDFLKAPFHGLSSGI